MNYYEVVGRGLGVLVGMIMRNLIQVGTEIGWLVGCLLPALVVILWRFRKMGDRLMRTLQKFT